MRPRGNEENGLIWYDEHIPYHQLPTVLSEAVARFAHLYGYGDTKCKLQSELLARPVHNPEDLKCHSPRNFRQKFSCTKPFHRYSSFRCGTRHAHSLYDWFMHHFRKMSYATCRDDMARHTTRFISVV